MTAPQGTQTTNDEIKKCDPNVPAFGMRVCQVCGTTWSEFCAPDKCPHCDAESPVSVCRIDTDLQRLERLSEQKYAEGDNDTSVVLTLAVSMIRKHEKVVELQHKLSEAQAKLAAAESERNKWEYDAHCYAAEKDAAEQARKDAVRKCAAIECVHCRNEETYDGDGWHSMPLGRMLCYASTIRVAFPDVFEEKDNG